MIGSVYCAITAEGHFSENTPKNPTFLHQHFKQTGFRIVRLGEMQCNGFGLKNGSRG